MITAERALELTLEVAKNKEAEFNHSVDSFLEGIEKEINRAISNEEYNTTVCSDKPMKLLENVRTKLVEFGYNVTLIKNIGYPYGKHELKIYWHPSI
jgi:hypothetical protein